MFLQDVLTENYDRHTRHMHPIHFPGHHRLVIFAQCAECHAGLKALMIGPHGVQHHITFALEFLLLGIKAASFNDFYADLDILSAMVDYHWLASTMNPAKVLLDIMRYCLDARHNVHY